MPLSCTVQAPFPSPSCFSSSVFRRSITLHLYFCCKSLSVHIRLSTSLSLSLLPLPPQPLAPSIFKMTLRCYRCLCYEYWCKSFHTLDVLCMVQRMLTIATIYFLLFSLPSSTLFFFSSFHLCLSLSLPLFRSGKACFVADLLRNFGYLPVMRSS